MPERYYKKRHDLRYQTFSKQINQVNQKIVQKTKKCKTAC